MSTENKGDANFVITAEDKTKATFEQVEKRFGGLANKAADSAGKLASTASWAGYMSGIDGISHAAQAASGALGLMGGAMELLGGPAGIALAAAAGLFAFVSSSEKTSASIDQLDDKISQANGHIATLTGNMVQAKQVELADDIRKLNKEIDELREKTKTGPSLFGSDSEYWKQQDLIAARRKEVNALTVELDKYDEMAKKGIKDPAKNANDAKSAEDARKAAAAALDGIKQNFAETDNAAAAHYAKYMDIINKAYKAGAISDAKAAAERADAQKRYMGELDAANKKEQDAAAAKFDAMSQSLGSEEDIIYKSYYNRLKIIDDAAAKGAKSQQEIDAARFAAENDLQTKLAALDTQKENERQAIRAKFDQMQQSGYDPAQKAAEQYASEMDVIQQGEDNKTVTLEEANQARLDAQQRYNAQMLQIENAALSANMKLWQAGYIGRLQLVSGVLGQMSVLMQSHNKSQFELGKRAAIAQTVIDTYAAAQKSYSAMAGIPYIGPILGVIAAAAAIASGMARVQAIRSTNFESGSTSVAVGSGGVSVGTNFTSGVPDTQQAAPTLPALTQQTQQPRNVNISIESDSGMVSTQWVRDTLMPRINDAIGDGVVLRGA